MAVEERRRMALYDALRRALDDDNADTLMGLLPPAGWGDVATTESVRSQVDQLRMEMAAQGSRLRQEMADLRTETRTGLAGVRTEMADLRAELHATMAANQRQLMFGLFGTVAANAGVVWAALSVAG